MGTTSVADLKAYTFGAAKNFSFSLADCPTAEEGGNSIARVTFGGVSDTANSDYFKTVQLMSRQPASLWPFSTKRAM